MSIKTTTKQDITLVRGIFKLFNEGKKISPFAISIMLRDYEYLLDGRPLDLDSMEAAEKIRWRNYGNYCKEIVHLLQMMGICTDYYETISHAPLFIPTDMRFIKLTKFGAMFSRFPDWLQHSLFIAIQLVYLIKFTFIKYKWIITLITACYGYLHWFKTHDISVYLGIITGIVGLISTIALTLFNRGSAAFGSNDDIG